MRTSMDALTQKFGYMEVKQSSKVKGRKLKTWRRRWVVFTKMSDLSSDQIVGKLDLYDNETKWRTDPSNKMTFVLEHVTSVRMSTSRTHPHAFEIVDRQPGFVFSGTTELETYSWLLTFQQIFTPYMVETNKDCYTVTIQPNEDSMKWELNGEYNLTVSDNGVSLVEIKGTLSHVKVSWGLSTLIRFNMETTPGTEEINLLVIKCGPNSPTGESTFKFVSQEAKDIIKTIRYYICMALAHKQNVRCGSTNRIRSVSATYSESNFLNMLDNQPVFRDRAGSDSSNSTFGSSSPISASPNIGSPELMGRGDGSFRMVLRNSGSELGVVDEADEHAMGSSQGFNDRSRGERDSGCISEFSLECNDRTRSVSLGAKDSKSDVDQGRSHSFGVRDSNVDTDQWRSQSMKGKETKGEPIQLRSKSLETEHSKEDHGYSVIKDVVPQTKTADGGGVKFTLSDTSLEQTDIPAISAEVSEELVLPASLITQYRSDDPSNLLQSSDSDEANASSLTSTNSFDIAEEGRKKDNDPIYQELDKHGKYFMTPEAGTTEKESIADPSVSPQGRLDKRRSSSMGDINSFMMKLGLDAGLENVYEELEVRKRKFFTRSQRKQVKEVPPALPARPMTINFSTVPKDCDNQPVVRLKNALVGKSSSSKRKSPEPVVRKSKTKSCTCKIPKSSKRSFNSKRTTCASCGGNIKDLGAIQGSSSKTTQNPVTRSSPSQDEASSKIHPTMMSSSLCRTESTSLIDLNDSVDSMSEMATLSSHASQATRPCSKQDPLIGFFLDDEKFDTNPLVTGSHPGKPDFQASPQVTGSLPGKPDFDPFISLFDEPLPGNSSPKLPGFRNMPPPSHGLQPLRTQSPSFPNTGSPVPVGRPRRSSTNSPPTWQRFHKDHSKNSVSDPWSPTVPNAPTTPFGSRKSNDSPSFPVSFPDDSFALSPNDMFPLSPTISSLNTPTKEDCYMTMNTNNNNNNKNSHPLSPLSDTSSIFISPLSQGNNMNSLFPRDPFDQFDVFAQNFSPSPKIDSTTSSSSLDPFSSQWGMFDTRNNTGMGSVNIPIRPDGDTPNHDNIYVRPGWVNSKQ